MRRSAEDAARTRMALLDAALLEFEEKGWRGATFEHVAERAGVTRGALHHHFRSKAALLAEALGWGWSEYGNRLLAHDPAVVGSAADERTAGERTAGERTAGELTAGGAEAWLATLLGDFVTLLRRDARFRALASATVLVAPQALDDSSPKNAVLDEWRERIATVLAGTRTPVAAETAAGLVLVLLQGFTVTAVTRPDDLPQPDAQDPAIAALVRGLLDREGDSSS